MIVIKRFCYYTLFLSFIFLAQNRYLFSQENDTILFTEDFFDREQALELTLKFDIKEFFKGKMEDEYLPATLSYVVEDTIAINKQIRIKARGYTRRKICTFPPFHINIRKTGLQNNLLSDSDIKKVKIVSHCKSTKVHSQYLIQEYLAYKIFNIITDYSFKVCLLNIKYIDTGRKNKTYSHKAFMIEPEKLLAERLEAYPVKTDKAKYSQSDSLITTTMTIFQYMIGNVDFSVAGRHNLKLLVSKDFRKKELIPIPYDFDYAGLINTYYAIPSEKISIENVTDRFYRGLCRSDSLYNIVFDIFRDKRDEIFTLIESLEYLDSKTRKYMLSYLNEFYEEIEDPNFIKKEIRTTCG